jgi:hypothetical protein
MAMIALWILGRCSKTGAESILVLRSRMLQTGLCELLCECNVLWGKGCDFSSSALDVCGGRSRGSAEEQNGESE